MINETKIADQPGSIKAVKAQFPKLLVSQCPGSQGTGNQQPQDERDEACNPVQGVANTLVHTYGSHAS